MKNLLNKLQATRTQIVNKVEKRDESALKRSDKWHESQRAKAYESKTAELANTVEHLDEAINNLQEYLN
ncbi:hypothetical protein [Pseudotamlana carrageenivorans]|uniref:Uncharacterized protein n=1 Tax=Pseudotamlana carrageenivorans TaxID=2069432 RepID=A0A2I7SF46_9FLAO|nr:hypothetical protein [Tamlana carrageenivorans]AUS04518.1 hypothetical protein C1A40_03080 [Tamlana carrageenivorans]